MISKKIKNLIVKYLSGSATAEEVDKLDHWINDSENISSFKSFVKSHHAINYAMAEQNADEIKKELIERMRKEKELESKFRWQSVLKYAALVVLSISLGYFYQNYFSNPSNEIIPKVEFVTLEMEDGSIKVISEEGTGDLVDSQGNIIGTQNGRQLTFSTRKEVKGFEYKTLNVPYGRTVQLILSDSTSIHLNAGTTLKFPVKFREGERRLVYLSGEAYFNVTRNEENPFIVNSDELNVEVLGTQFNVSSYREDTRSEVVLVEGSVKLFTSEDSITRANPVLLEPGQAGSLGKSAQNIVIKEVVTSVYTSWIHGELVFRNRTFSNILKKMERHYNVEIENRNLELSNEKFNASFGNEPISKILKDLEMTYGIKYAINENKILIN